MISRGEEAGGAELSSGELDALLRGGCGAKAARHGTAWPQPSITCISSGGLGSRRRSGKIRVDTVCVPQRLFGGLPLALGGGIGSELRRPLGIAIVGGLIVSQLLTLYTTPVTYLYLDRLRLRRKAAEPAPEPVHA